MTTINTKRLRALAEAATPGPWEAVTTGVRGGDHWYVTAEDEAILHVSSQDGDNEGQREPLATYIAEIDPPTLIALLDELEKYRSWADRILGNPPDLNEQHERLKAQIAATGVLEQRVIQPGEARSL